MSVWGFGGGGGGGGYLLDLNGSNPKKTNFLCVSSLKDNVAHSQVEIIIYKVSKDKGIISLVKVQSSNLKVQGPITQKRQK